MGKKLRFRADGTFTIVQFTDLHWNNGEADDLKTRGLMERVLAAEQPDLIVFSGDVIDSLRCKNPQRSFGEAVAVAEKSGVPWAAIFGNHDSEGNVVTREQLMKVQTALDGCVAEAGPKEIDGVGNFVIRVIGANDRTAAALYFFDSGSYSALTYAPGYDWIHGNQVEWYRNQSRLLQNMHGGKSVPGLAFFHIPLPEYREVWERHICYGRRFEKVCCPPLNSGLFAAMIEEGGVMGTFCGHDHTNDFTGMLRGIRLCYGRATGYQTYGRWFYSRGARVIRLQEGGSFDTWIRLAGGKKLLQGRKHSPRVWSRS